MDHTGAVTSLCLILAITVTNVVHSQSPRDYGRLIGDLTSDKPEVTGSVYAVDDHTIYVKGFTFDKQCNDAFFWMGTTPLPSSEGTLIPYPVHAASSLENSSPLGSYKGSNVILRIPAGKTILDFMWFAVWCRSTSEKIAHILIPTHLEIPRPQILPEFSRLKHSLESANITVLDSKTFRIPNLHYDGTAPTAFFWVGKGAKGPNIEGKKVPNENNSTEPLKKYTGQEVVITLPGDLTVHDIDYLGMWCVNFKQNFGYVEIPKNLNVPPFMGQSKLPIPKAPKNCREMIPGHLQVQWQLINGHVQIQLVGKMNDEDFMSFGERNGEDKEAKVPKGDFIVTFYDKQSGTFKAVDYYASGPLECDGQSGICPDERIGGTNDAVLVSGFRRKGITMVLFTRPLQTVDQNDRNITLEQFVTVIASIGPLNSKQEVSTPMATTKNSGVVKINFSSANDNTCAKSLFEVASPEQAYPVQGNGGARTESSFYPIGIHLLFLAVALLA